MPMQFCNGLLLSLYTFFHAIWPVLLPEEPILVVCKFHFPYLKYLI
jgi:hypothetical protein